VVRERSDTVPSEPEALREAKRGFERPTPGLDCTGFEERRSRHRAGGGCSLAVIRRRVSAKTQTQASKGQLVECRAWTAVVTDLR